MTKFYERGASRIYTWDLIEAWAEAEEQLGLKNSIFFTETKKDGSVMVNQWVDIDEYEDFFKFLKLTLTTDSFDELCEKFFYSITIEDKVQMFKTLAIFHEIDEHPEIANDDILRRLKRVREETHEVIYNLK